MTTTLPTTVIRDLIRTNWNANNTDGRAPTIDIIHNFRRHIVRTTTNQGDSVLIYGGNWTDEYKDFRRDFVSRRFEVTADIRVVPISEGQDVESVYKHALKVADEVRRIIQANRKTPGNGFTQIWFHGWQDLSNRTLRLFRFVTDIELHTIVVDVTTGSE